MGDPARPPAKAPAPVLPRVLQRLLRLFLVISGAVAALTAVFMAVDPGGSRHPGLVIAGFLTLAALAGASARWLPARQLAAGLTAVLIGASLLRTANALSTGWGLTAPSLSAMGLTVCALAAVAGWRYGGALALASLACVTALAGLGHTPIAPGGAPVQVLLATAFTSIATGLAAGTVISNVIERFVHRARERSRRIRHLLALAADVHWELDADARLIAAGTGSGTPVAPAALGRAPWELPQFRCEPLELARLRDDLASRRAFRDVPITWHSQRTGRSEAFLVSGEPRQDTAGQFAGFWGVGRNVTQVLATRQALAATEMRYRRLFDLLPTALAMHREGIVFEANDAAARLFGFPDPAAMVGADLPSFCASEEERINARKRRAELQALPPGSALPLTTYHLLVQGQRRTVRTTSVSLAMPDGPALLAIYVDDTEREAASEAVRRSEALLAHLVETSPDLITLTEIDTGRYAMVNRAFEHTSGWSAAEAIGRTAAELGIWGSPEDRARFVAAVRQNGKVTDLPVRFMSRARQAISMVVSAAGFEMQGRDYMVINARDVSERERQRLEREAILTNASIGIAVTRAQRFVLANRHFEQIYGWPPGELVGQPGQVVWHDEADYAEVGRLMGPALARGEPVEVERMARRRDGSSFVARVRGRAVDPLLPRDGGTVWIVEDVTERREFERALARARDEAEAASRAKSAFLANTSHELRTPLNGMIGLARLARDAAVDEARRRQYLDQVVESAQSLAGIISDILDLSKIEAGKLQLETAVFDLGALLRMLQRHYATLAEAHGLTLTLQLQEAADTRVEGDALRVRQIVSNFLSNAVKFTQRGGITLLAERLTDGEGEAVRISVVDTGPGIAPETLPRLFQPFTQADESTTRRFGGTGLGLSICQQLALLMQGQVGVDSRLGLGSRFWVELPLPVATQPVTAPVPLEDLQALRGLRVLVAEDNAVNMLIAAALLESWGVVVAQAADGRAAVAAVKASLAGGRPFDAVLMDVQMPEMSGHEAARALREAGYRAPVIALTAAALVTEREAALAAGMDDFLTKPVDAEKLQAALLQWCRRRTAG
ncbi:MAG: PAS domain S-box protein [Rubrivivax sp.]|nr:PAS domain S-box protein [Rubrivivax sp.]